MDYDPDLESGLKNLQEILARLDDRANNIKWLKENAPADAPARITEAIKENFPAPKPKPQPEPAPEPAPAPEFQSAPTAAEPITAPAPTPAPAPAPIPANPPVEIPRLAPAPPPEAPAPQPAPEPIKPEPVKFPEPLPKLPEFPQRPAFLEEFAAPPAGGKELPPAMKPEPAPEPKAEPAPAPKPARKPLKLNKNAVILFIAGLAIAGAAYQLFINSAEQRYVRAGKLAASARNAEAITAYSRIINTYPRSIEAAYSYYAIGDIKALQGDSAGAIASYEKYMVAAPDKDPKLASSRFKVAELKYKEGDLADAAYLYQNPVVQASEFAGDANERVKKIKSADARLAEAKKLLDKSPAKALELCTAVADEQPKYPPALAAEAEAKKALEAFNSRPAPKKPAKPAAKKTPAKPAPAKAQARTVPAQGQEETCAAIWDAEKAGGTLSADMMFSKVKFNCDALRQRIDNCREARDAAMALQGVPPEARVEMEQEINPNWTLAQQLAQDEKIRKAYTDSGCIALLKKN